MSDMFILIFTNVTNTCLVTTFPPFLLILELLETFILKLNVTVCYNGFLICYVPESLFVYLIKMIINLRR